MNMNSSRLTQRRGGAWAGLVVVLAGLLALDASAALTHRYSFTSDASDSVGGANGMNQASVPATGRSAFYRLIH